MQKYFAVATIILMIGMVLVRVRMMKKMGIVAMNFGKTDKTDFLIPPFPLFYFYLIFANSFNLPTIAHQEFYRSETVSWLGVLSCFVGLAFLLWSLISFGESFRVGIDIENPDRLITNGAFAVSRNPIYVAFTFILLGQFLIFPNWILLVFMLAWIWLSTRQIRREEDFLKEHYGNEYAEYCLHVRRYL